MYEDENLAKKLEKLEHKIDRFFGYLFRFLAQHVASDLKMRKRVAEFLEEKPDDPYEKVRDDDPSVKVFGVDVNDQGDFEFNPPRWDYGTGSKLRWVSGTGKFSIHLNEYEDGLPSPFTRDNERQPVVRSESDPDGDKWKTEPVTVTSVFSEEERTARRLAGKGPAYYRYIVALQKDGEVYIDTGQNGFAC